MKLAEHFDSTEFKCNCGNNPPVSQLLVDRLEKLHKIMAAKAVKITSGYRCPLCSVKIGGHEADAHTYGIAADIQVQKQNGEYYTGYEIAEVAERLGFGGIGVMNMSCHVDTRDKEKYSNNHWWGDETTGNDWVKTFQIGTVYPGEENIEIKEEDKSQEKPRTMKKIISITWLDENGETHIENFK